MRFIVTKGQLFAVTRWGDAPIKWTMLSSRGLKLDSVTYPREQARTFEKEINELARSSWRAIEKEAAMKETHNDVIKQEVDAEVRYAEAMAEATKEANRVWSAARKAEEVASRELSAELAKKTFWERFKDYI